MHVLSFDERTMIHNMVALELDIEADQQVRQRRICVRRPRCCCFPLWSLSLSSSKIVIAKHLEERCDTRRDSLIVHNTSCVLLSEYWNSVHAGKPHGKTRHVRRVSPLWKRISEVIKQRRRRKMDGCTNCKPTRAYLYPGWGSAY